MSYSQINWENAPSTKTPINAENLKHMDEGIAKAHEIEAELEIYKANSIISTFSGTVFHETDCAAVPPINIKLFGKGKQEVVPGNQLLDASRIPTTTKGNVSVVNNGDGSFTISGDGSVTDGINAKVEYKNEETIKLVKSGTLTLLVNQLTKPYCYVHFYYDNDNKRVDITCYSSTKMSAEITEEMLDDTCHMTVGIFGYAGDEIIGGTIKPMLYQDGDGTFEPYVGGEQSPNMKYPQIPEFLGESGSVAGKVLGKNLLDESDILAQSTGYLYCVKNPMLFKSGMTYTIKTYGYSYRPDSIQIEGVDGIATYIYGSDTLTYSFEKDFKGSIRFYWLDVANIPPIEDVYTQIELGSVATEYEPYRAEQPFTSLTPNGLRGIPLGQTIPDAIKNSPIHMSGVYWDSVEQQYCIADTENEDGKDVQRIVEYVVDGTESKWFAYDLYRGFYLYGVLPFVSIRRNGFCNQLRVDTNATILNNSLSIGVGDKNIYLWGNQFYDETLEDKGLSNLKAHLNENPLVIYTWLDEPIVTETDAQCEVVMNYPNTTIVNDAGAYMEVEYVADTQKHIEQNYVSKEAYNEHENRIAELEKAIVNS